MLSHEMIKRKIIRDTVVRPKAHEPPELLCFIGVAFATYGGTPSVVIVDLTSISEGNVLLFGHVC